MDSKRGIKVPVSSSYRASAGYSGASGGGAKNFSQAGSSLTISDFISDTSKTSPDKNLNRLSMRPVNPLDAGMDEGSSMPSQNE